MTVIKTIGLVLVACLIPYIIFVTAVIVAELISSIISMTAKQVYELWVILLNRISRR
jgi:hypothetical protein